MASKMTQFRRWLVLPQFRHVIYVTPKVANRSIVVFFNRLYGSASSVTNPSRSMHRWLTLDEVEECCPDWPRVVTVRNPVDRILGVYNYHVLGRGLTKDGSLQKIGLVPGMPLTAFLDIVTKNVDGNAHWSPVCHASDRFDRVIRFEALDADWDAYCRDMLDGTPLRLEHIGKTRRRVNSTTRGIITSVTAPHYRDELEAFGYADSTRL